VEDNSDYEQPDVASTGAGDAADSSQDEDEEAAP
jgi:hypothetical protein